MFPPPPPVRLGRRGAPVPEFGYDDDGWVDKNQILWNRLSAAAADRQVIEIPLDLEEGRRRVRAALAGPRPVVMYGPPSALREVDLPTEILGGAWLANATTAGNMAAFQAAVAMRSQLPLRALVEYKKIPTGSGATGQLYRVEIEPGRSGWAIRPHTNINPDNYPRQLLSN